MAEEQEDAVFWLPSEFLAECSTEDDDTEGFITTAGPCNDGYSFPSEFPFDWLSPTGGSSSPGVDSFLTETESEEDGFSFAGRASGPFYQSATEDGKDLACSPQSTLWEGPVSELESPLSPLKSQQHSDLVCEVETQLARIRIDRGGEQQKTQQQQSTPCLSPSGMAVSATTSSTATAWSSSIPVPALQKLQVNSKQGGAWGKQGKSVINEGAAGYGGGPLGLPSSAWPPLKQSQKTEAPPQSGTSTVIPGGPAAAAAAAQRESYGGTGFFLPRNNHLNNRPHIRRKKSAPCTPVLLPARVVEALKLDLDENGSIRRMPHAIILDQDAIVAHNMTLLHRRGLLPRSAATTAANPKTARLPQEWTY